MSDSPELVDLTLLGCPMHTIKAREAARRLTAEKALRLLLNTDALATIRKNLIQDGYQCVEVSSDGDTTVIEVTQSHD